MNSSQAKLLAEKSGWTVADYGQPVGGFTMSFHKPDRAAIWVRFSPTGILTKVEGHDFVTDIHSFPRKDKSTRLSHYLTEGITHD